MHRFLFSLTALSGALLPLVFDSALKGGVLLAASALCALALGRASAAARHLVWLAAILALLLLPVLSAVLPQWRVLPGWTRTLQPAVGAPAASTAPLPAASQALSEPAPRSGAAPADAAPAPVPASAQPLPPHGAWPGALVSSPKLASAWRAWLAPVWASGAALLGLRLAAAHFLLRRSARRCVILNAPGAPGSATAGHIEAAFAAACAQLGVRQRILLLLAEGPAIPIVWGVFHPRLLLPAEARAWGEQQLRSVLLHELAHLQRRDTLIQWLTQIACALHWFNPLVWLAAWRLHIERERACDDLVLASGVRASLYAEHLLQVATKLSPPRWTLSCGLAMARKSSLEGRLLAVLSEKLNRRRVTATLAAAALLLAAGLAIPIAMLRAAEEKPVEKPKVAQKLSRDAEEKLLWGQPEKGLRAAIVIRATPGETKPGDLPDLYLAVQNVSETPIHFSDTTPAADLRRLLLKSDGRIQASIGSNDPTGTDVVLQPREFTFVLLFRPEPRDADGHTTGSLLANDVVKDPHQTIVAELQIDKPPAGAWTGKLVTGDASGAEAAGLPWPKDKDAQALYSLWRQDTRGNGNIPSGLMAKLGAKVQEFIHNNTGDAAGDPYAKKMELLAPRFNAAGDWTPAQVAPLLDEIAAITPIPLITTKQEAAERTFKVGRSLPAELANAPWGAPLPSGLRVAWLLEPRAKEHRLGTPLAARILFHNSGKNTVVFRTRTWHQAGHKAIDAKGAEIHVNSVFWTTIGQFVAFRLEPGDFVEVTGPGVGVGPMNNSEDWQETRVGSWVEAKAGDDVTVSTAPVLLSDGTEAPPVHGEADWWPDFIAARLASEAPLPADLAERTALLARVVHDLFGTEPTAEETAAFLADRDPHALDALAQRLAHRPGFMPAAGSLTSGETKFRVLPADPDAARKPRTAKNPGQYTLGGNATLAVSRRPDGDRIRNEAAIRFSSADPSQPSVAPYEIKLPDGYNTWAAAWERGAGVLWVLQNGSVRSYDFTNPATVKETPFDEPALSERAPKPIVEALRAVLSAPKQAPEPPASTAPPATEKPTKLHSADRTGIYELGGGRKLYICKPQSGDQAQQRFAVFWPAAADAPKRSVRILPNGGKGTKWAVLFEPGSDVLWWVDENEVGKVRFTNPAQVVVDREGRKNNFSPDFAPSDDVKKEFHKLGYDIGGDQASGEETEIGEQILQAEPLVPDELVPAPFPEPEPLVLEPLVPEQLRNPATAARAKAPPADDSGTKSGIPFGDLKEEVEWSGGDGPLYLGMRIAGGQWQVGGKVKVELWACNPGENDLRFARSPRTDVGLAVIAIDKEGQEHYGNITMWDSYPVFDHLILPAEHVVKLKEFTVRFGPEKAANPALDGVMFHLTPGDYSLRCKWSDSHAAVARAGEWSGELTTGGLGFALIAPASDSPEAGAAPTGAGTPAPPR